MSSKERGVELPLMAVFRFSEFVAANGVLGLAQPMVGHEPRVLKGHLTAVSACAETAKTSDASTTRKVFVRMLNLYLKKFSREDYHRRRKTVEKNYLVLKYL